MGTTTNLPLFPDLPHEPNNSSRGSPAAILLGLGQIKGLGQKGLVAILDAVQGDFGKINPTFSGVVHQALLMAKVPAADHISAEFARNWTQYLERGASAAEELEGRGIRVVPRSELPDSLRNIPDAPLWLFVQGNLDALHSRPAVAIVGTRTPTSQGLRAADLVARVMAAYPIVLVSGLAEGIDEEAHRVSLQEGATNVAFLGHGINHTFPASTGVLRTKIIDQGGAVASEYMPDEHYQKRYFVQRNRLQAALADIVVPVEAHPTGGTAHTIRFARKYGRQIIGLRWKGADGLLSELERAGYPILDILTSAGWKSLDKLMRQLAEKEGKETFSLALIERRLQNEAKWRNLRPKDVERLMQRLTELGPSAQGDNDG